MCQFSDIKSHPDLPLEKHLTQVAKIAVELFENKNINFPSLGLTKEHLKELIKRTEIGRASCRERV